MHQRHASLRMPPIGFGHRGAKAHAPENTLEAFALALKLGATGLESDVWITADGHAILDHDGVVRRGVFDLLKRPVSEVRRNELPDHIPTLAELLDVCGTDYELSLDVKDAEAVRETIRVAREAGIEQRMWLCYPQWEVVASWRDLTSAKLVDSSRYSHMREGPERRAAALANAGIDAINMHHSDWSGGLCTLFHRFDRYCLGWDAQLERVIGELVAMGLDGVYSDHVDRLMNVIDSPSEPEPT